MLTAVTVHVLAIVLTSLLLAIDDGQTRRAPWPRVQSLTARFPIDLRVDKIVIDLPLVASDGGQVIYTFACRGGHESYLDKLRDNWVGPLMCTLAEGEEASDGSLLSEDHSAAWFSRGQFRRSELVGECGRYPEFGVRRSFRLRGFRLHLNAEDIEIDRDGTAQSFVLAVSVVSDAKATTAYAERPGFLDPRRAGGSCGRVVRGREPLMCRNKDFSWEVCK